MSRERLIDEIREALAKTGFFVSAKHGERGLCFDLVARRDRALLFVKVLQNVDAFSKANATELKVIARTLEGAPLLVGGRSGTGPLEEGVLYTRFDVPIVSHRTFLELLEDGVPPFIFSAPGGLYVNLDTGVLRTLREERQISLGTLAEVAGVSRRTIQMYLEGMSATVDVALRLEEFLGQSIVLPVDPLTFPQTMERVIASSFAGLEAFERDLFRRLARLGYDVLPTHRSPFEAFTQHDKTTLLTGVGDSDTPIERKAVIVANIRRIVEKDAVLFVERRTIRTTIQGVPVIGREEVRKAKDLDAVEDLIAARKG
ncbi:MAG TPA: transcriptional regulator [Thermoplasmata archaeon]|nr:transcriptional regulator [Thermoplasmata archaeon]